MSSGGNNIVPKASASGILANLTAENGLYKPDDTTVRLGGDLLEDTTVNLAQNFDLIFSGVNTGSVKVTDNLSNELLSANIRTVKFADSVTFDSNFTFDFSASPTLNYTLDAGVQVGKLLQFTATDLLFQYSINNNVYLKGANENQAIELRAPLGDPATALTSDEVIGFNIDNASSIVYLHARRASGDTFKLSLGGSSGLTGTENGLSDDGTNARLGGTLNQNTTITLNDGASRTLNFASAIGFTTTLEEIGNYPALSFKHDAPFSIYSPDYLTFEKQGVTAQPPGYSFLGNSSSYIRLIFDDTNGSTPIITLRNEPISSEASITFTDLGFLTLGSSNAVKLGGGAGNGVFTALPQTEPNDLEIDNNEMVTWLDDGTDTLNFKYKDSAGNVTTKTL